MMFSLFDLTVPRFQRALGVLLGLLDKAEAHGVAALADLRLATDMQPFPFQVAAAINNAVAATRRLRGVAPEDVGGLSTVEAMRGALERALGELGALTPADFEGAVGREIVLPNAKGARHFPAPDYVLNLALPNVLFHTSMAYALLRAAGVEIGKRDFLGPLPPRREAGAEWETAGAGPARPPPPDPADWR